MPTEQEIEEIKRHLADAGIAPDDRTHAEVEADAARITGAEAPEVDDAPTEELPVEEIWKN